MNTRGFEENTGAVIKNDSGHQSLYHILEEKCPYFHCLNDFFREKIVYLNLINLYPMVISP